MCDWGGGPNSIANYYEPKESFRRGDESKKSQAKAIAEYNEALCEECGREVSSSHNYCPNCGTRKRRATS